ncbi:MAG: hypothetical protein FD131_3396 [Rhodocyclaceae bacterium]|nr:MAG: hypothetical protein FD131_3396 [Rhodocyclaceae bacterium]
MGWPFTSSTAACGNVIAGVADPVAMAAVANISGFMRRSGLGTSTRAGTARVSLSTMLLM